jgi:hypothetical protein
MSSTDKERTRDYASVVALDQGASFDLTPNAEGEKMSIWTILFVVLLIAWISGFTVFHVAGGLIHLLLLFAVVSLILHFVMGRRSA